MRDDLEKLLFDEPSILARLDVMAEEIMEAYRGRDLTVVAVLNGSLIFAADLMRRLDLPLKLVCARASSYHGGTESTGQVRLDREALAELAGRHVLIVDDILDTGRTLHALSAAIWETGPLSVEICVLLRKEKARAESVEARYSGFELGDEFVVGYGLDFQERYRNLPIIATLRREVIAAGLSSAT